MGYRRSPDILCFDDENMKTGEFDDDRSLRLRLAQGDHRPGALSI